MPSDALPKFSDLIFPSSAPPPLCKTKHTTKSSATSAIDSAAPTLNHLLADVKRQSLSLANRLQSIAADAEFVTRTARTWGFLGSDYEDQGEDGVYARGKKKEGEEGTVASKVGAAPGIIVNERCGRWYVAPEARCGSAYFKSTDGHTGAWAFSLRRLNLHLLDLVGRHGGAMIVDSTRRGKRLPDALSKTIPIWVCVMNRALFPPPVPAPGTAAEECLVSGSYHELRTAPGAVGPSEQAQIATRIPAWVAAFCRLGLDLEDLRTKLRGRPMRCLWLTADDDEDDWQGEDMLVDQLLDAVRNGEECDSGADVPRASLSSSSGHTTLGRTGGSRKQKLEKRYMTVFDDAHPLILVSASRSSAGSELAAQLSSSSVSLASNKTASPFTYVQGAADDTENWARGLDADLWWRHRDALLSAAASNSAGCSMTTSIGVDALVDEIVASRAAMTVAGAGYSNGGGEGYGDADGWWKRHASPLGAGLWVGGDALVGVALVRDIVEFCGGEDEKAKEKEEEEVEDEEARCTDQPNSSGNDGTQAAETFMLIQVTPDNAPFFVTKKLMHTRKDAHRQLAVLVRVGLGKVSKMASRNLRRVLPDICAASRDFLFSSLPSSLSQGLLKPANSKGEAKNGGREAGAASGVGRCQQRASSNIRSSSHKDILIVTPSPTDLSVGVALALHCMFVADDMESLRPFGSPSSPVGSRPAPEDRTVDSSDAGNAENTSTITHLTSTGEFVIFTKDLIRIRTSRIVSLMPTANPNRSTLQSVNSYLMG